VLDTTNLVAAWEMSDAVVSTGVIDSVPGSHGTTGELGLLSGPLTNRPKYYATGGPTGGPCAGLGNTDAVNVTRFDIDTLLRASAGPITCVALINHTATGTLPQFLLDSSGASRVILTPQTSSAPYLAGFYDGTYKPVTDATPATGWQIIAWRLQTSGGELFRNYTLRGSATFIERAWTLPISIGSRFDLSSASPFHGYLERLYFFDAAISDTQLDNVRDYIFQEATPWLWRTATIPAVGSTDFESIAAADLPGSIYGGARWKFKMVMGSDYKSASITPLYVDVDNRILCLNTSGDIRWYAGGVTRTLTNAAMGSPGVGDEIELDLDFVSGAWSGAVNSGTPVAGTSHTGPVTWASTDLGIATVDGGSTSSFAGTIYPALLA
jgi:hypothetical protein